LHIKPGIQVRVLSLLRRCSLKAKARLQSPRYSTIWICYPYNTSPIARLLV
jgi:hypothetical protein